MKRAIKQAIVAGVFAQMQSLVRINSRLLFATTISLSISVPVFAEQQVVHNTTINAVVVNGGTDTTNPGTTCLWLSSAVSGACSGQMLAIPNNNKQLVAAALTAKATGSKIWVYYEDAEPLLHCPGKVFTPCSVISISLQ